MCMRERERREGRRERVRRRRRKVGGRESYKAVGQMLKVDQPR